ncbi:MAG TPA: hypothetical protein VM143_15090 [Acidimicrobiales bacterium]|nr:hypothetical protein [Acidimicrobiales bacterium]
MTEPAHVDGAVMVSFGAVHPGRERLAVETFTDLSRFFGERLSDGDLTSFQPFFYSGGAVDGRVGFFLLEGHRERLAAMAAREDFTRLLLRAGAATADVRVDPLTAGPDAGRLVNLFREVRDELGLL